MKGGMIAMFDGGRAARTRRPWEASTRLASSDVTGALRASSFRLSPLILLLALLLLLIAACSDEPPATDANEAALNIAELEFANMAYRLYEALEEAERESGNSEFEERLFGAILARDREMAAVLAKEIAAIKVESGDSDLEGRLFDAVLDGDTRRVTSLLDQGADIEALMIVDYGGGGHTDDSFFGMFIATFSNGGGGGGIALFNFSPLHVAAANGDAEMVALLLDRGANSNTRGEYGWTPLHFTVAFVGDPFNQRDVIRALLDAGGDPNVKSKFGTTPLIIAESEADFTTIELIRGAVEAGQ